MNYKRWMNCISLLLLLMVWSGPNAVFAQKAAPGEISGVVKDQSSNEPLPFATVVIKGTVTGTVTDMDGAFRLANLQPGDYTLQISYIGYTKKEVPVILKSGEKKKTVIEMDQPLVTLGEVVVSSQRLGQNAAINQQLNSSALVNVVSKDAIRELPDVNAAEAIGRLPGVSLVRSNGEGSKVVLRGLDPKFSAVSINGVSQPSTDMSVNGDRSTDLSGISPELLSGIEVFKSPTADMDGDAIAGTINLVIAKAPEISRNQIRLYGGYSNLYKKASNFKGSWDYSSRFLDKKLGVMAQANYEQTDRSSQSMDIAYFDPNAQVADSFFINSTNATERKQLTKRAGGLLMLDYQFQNGGIFFTNIFNSSPRTSFTHSKLISRDGTLTHSANINESTNKSINSSLGGNYNLKRLKTDWSLSRVQSWGQNPSDFTVNFLLGAPNGLIPGIAGKDTRDPKYFWDNMVFNSTNMKKDSVSYLQNSDWQPDTLKQTTYIAKLDFELPVKLGDKIAGFFKFGGKYQSENRQRSGLMMRQPQYYLKPALSDLAIKNEPDGKLDLTVNRYIQMSNFNEQKVVPIMNGAYDMFPVITEGEVKNWYKNHLSETNLDPSNNERFYDALETVSSGYAMFKLNYGDLITLIPGIRYEYSNNVYHGVYSTISGDVGNFGYIEQDTSMQKYHEWLPSAHLKIKPKKWMDVRLSAAKTLSRPNYMWVIPRFRYNSTNYSVAKANPELEHATAWNFDASVTIYTNNFGLFSFGGYDKEISNMFYQISGTLSPEEAVQNGLPPQSFDLNEDYINLENSYVRGLEFEYNTHFNFLPSPFNRFVLGVNFTRLWSKTYYLVWNKVENLIVPNGVRPVMEVDFTKSYHKLVESRMPSQVDLTSNAWLGYDYKNFSTRVSMSYQGTRLTSINPNSDQIGYNRYADSYMRFDVTMKQKLNKYFSLLLNLNNLTNTTERSFRYISDFPTSENMYGFSFDFGVQLNFQ